jgi:hypothetical protein
VITCSKQRVVYHHKMRRQLHMAISSSDSTRWHAM